MLTPHKYQQKALQFALDNPSSYCAMDMGLGKTLVTIMWTLELLERTTIPGVLVVASLRGLYSTWPDELEIWAPDLKATRLHGPNKAEALRKPADIYYINYEGLQWLFNELKKIFKATGKLPFRAIVLDEASRAKAHNTKRFKVLKVFADVAPMWKLLLSGTPAPNSYLDLWAQYYFLDGGERLGKTITQYRDRHFNQFEIKQKKIGGKVVMQRKKIFGYVLKEGHDEIINNLIADITFRLDAADYLNLPEQMFNTISIKLSDKEYEQYKTLETEFFLELEETEFEALNAASLAMKLRQFVQGGLYHQIKGRPGPGERPYDVVHTKKLEALQNIFEEAGGQSILCAIQFRFELDMIRKAFPNAPVIAGGTSAEEAGRLISSWNRGEIPLMLCHPGSISDSVNLQAGGHIIVWYAMTWSLYHYLQFNARLYRQGQLNAVMIHHLIVQGTIDTRILAAQQAKFKGQRELLDFLKGLR